MVETSDRRDYQSVGRRMSRRVSINVERGISDICDAKLPTSPSGWEATGRRASSVRKKSTVSFDYEQPADTVYTDKDGRTCAPHPPSYLLPQTTKSPRKKSVAPPKAPPQTARGALEGTNTRETIAATRSRSRSSVLSSMDLRRRARSVVSDFDDGLSDENDMVPLTFRLNKNAQHQLALKSLNIENDVFRREVWDIEHREYFDPNMPTGIEDSRTSSRAHPRSTSEAQQDPGCVAEAQRYGIEIEVGHSRGSTIATLTAKVGHLKKRYNQTRYQADTKARSLEKLIADFTFKERTIMTTSGEGVVEQMKKLQCFTKRLNRKMSVLNEEKEYTSTLELIRYRLLTEKQKFNKVLQKMNNCIFERGRYQQRLVHIINRLEYRTRNLGANRVKYETTLGKEHESRREKLENTMAMMEDTWVLDRYIDKRSENRLMLQEAIMCGVQDTHGDTRTQMSASVRNFITTTSNEEEDHRKIALFEGAMERFKDATGVLDPHELVGRHFTAINTFADLSREAEEAKRQVDALVAEKETLTVDIASEGFGDKMTHKVWVDSIDGLEARMHNAYHLVIHFKRHAQECNELYATTQALAEMIAHKCGMPNFEMPKQGTNGNGTGEGAAADATEDERPTREVAMERSIMRINTMFKKVETFLVELLENNDFSKMVFDHSTAEGVTETSLLISPTLSLYNLRVPGVVKSDREYDLEQVRTVTSRTNPLKATFGPNNKIVIIDERSRIME